MNLNLKQKLKKLKEEGCGEPQTTGWNCNPGHLCADCEIKMAMLEALIKYERRVLKAIDKLEGCPYVKGYDFSKQTGYEQIAYLQALEDLRKELGFPEGR
jgi:hypothetical protein